MMQAILMTPRAQAVLHDGRPLRILHRFDNLVNLVNDKRQVITISNTAVSPGPFSLIVDSQIPTQIDEHSPVATKPDKRIISIGSLVIKTDQAALWNPTPDWSKLRESTLPSRSLPAHLPAEIAQPYQSLQSALIAHNMEQAQTAVQAMAGLGGGLTPAGDDVLTGVIFALWVCLPDSPFIKKIAGWAAPRTTTLSAATLYAASAGEASSHWHEIIAGKPGALEQLLAIGHTSGRDAWYGFSETHKLLMS